MNVPPQRLLWKRLGWFVTLWAAGVLAVALLAFLVKAIYPAW